jgi:predicted GH43/DUF377 family glycosyl hydrolase
MKPMAQRPHQQLLIQPKDVKPSNPSMQVIGTFNPGVCQRDGDVFLLVRVAERPIERREGYTALPRWETEQLVTDWVANDELESLDPRVVRRRADNLLRLTFTSHLCVVRSRDGRTIDQWDVARMYPRESWEEYGIEDPRITRIDGRYWITYVAVSRHGAATALASTEDLLTFERHGIIFCPENKDVVLFPERIGGQFVALHRPATAHSFCRPEMWLARSPDLLNWGSHQPLYGGSAAWETDRVGAGAPPLRTDAGWLEIYHASRCSQSSGEVGAYVAGVMLLDLDDPSRVIARGPAPVLQPDASYELSGFVPHVVFPTGIIARDNIVQLYYGAADTCTAMIAFRLCDLVAGAAIA